MSHGRSARRGFLVACLATACSVADTTAGCAPEPPRAPTPAKPVPSIEPAPAPTEPPVTREPVTPGTRELVKQLEQYESLPDPAERWLKCQQTLRKIRDLADPRGADALHASLGHVSSVMRKGERVHVRTEIAMALAEIGDLRAVPALAERLELDSLELYDDSIPQEAELKRDDAERVVSARLIADLAVLHAGERARIRSQAEKSVWAWATDMPSPHANALRALARMQTENPDIRVQIRKWADPSAPLPKLGQEPPFPEEFVIAQSSLRYLGALGDDRAAAIFEKQLKRRPKRFDATMDSLLQGGGALLGMTLRALETGASDGLSELGSPKAFSALDNLIGDDKENEQARLAACRAAVWIAGEGEARQIAKHIEKWGQAADPKTRFRLVCFLDAIADRPLAAVRPVLFALVETGDTGVRQVAARALGKAGLDEETERKLLGRLRDSSLGIDAALALLLGGSPESAKKVVEAYPTRRAAAHDEEEERARELGEGYFSSFGSVSQEDLDSGRLFRWVENALAAGPAWPRDVLAKQLGNIQFDAGPHTLTRVVLRQRLFDLARRGTGARQKSAIAVLELMNERGALLALDGS